LNLARNPEGVVLTEYGYNRRRLVTTESVSQSSPSMLYTVVYGYNGNRAARGLFQAMFRQAGPGDRAATSQLVDAAIMGSDRHPV
jgi:hypothetical protein